MNNFPLVTIAIPLYCSRRFADIIAGTAARGEARRATERRAVADIS